MQVRDAEIGIAPDQSASVLEPFVKVDARLTGTREGTGPGLAIRRGPARDLAAGSVSGAGRVFTLTMPRA